MPSTSGSHREICMMYREFHMVWNFHSLLIMTILLLEHYVINVSIMEGKYGDAFKIGPNPAQILRVSHCP